MVAEVLSDEIYVRKVITLYLCMSNIGYIEQIHAKIKFTHGIFGGRGDSHCVCVCVLIV